MISKISRLNKLKKMADNFKELKSNSYQHSYVYAIMLTSITMLECFITEKEYYFHGIK